MTPQPTSALITGGNKGLGLETARRLGEQGWTIFLGSRDPGRGHAAADQLTARDMADNPRVVMVSSAIGSRTIATDPTQPPARFHELAYSSSKAALNMITIRYAKALPEIKFNLLTPGEIANGKYTATDINNHTGQLTVTEGSDPIIELATIDADGPTATFIDRLGPIPW